MSDYGAQDTSTTSLGANQFPISEAWTPNAGFSAVEGGPQSTDAGGKKSAPVSVYVKDGGNVAQGLTTDAAVTGDNPGTLSAKARGLSKIFTDIWDSVNHRIKVDGSGVTQPVSGTVTANAGTNLNTSLLALESGGNLASAKSDLDTIVTNTNKIPASPAQEGGHLATIDTSTSNANTAIGTKTDTKATDGSVTAWSVIALLKGIIDKLLSTLAVTQSGTWTVQPGNTANTTAWKVDGSGVTQPVSGTFWQATQPVSGTFWQATQPVSGTVTANQGGAPWTDVPTAATTGGSTPSHTMSAASTNATSLKASAGQIYGLSISNANAAARYFKLYNKASAPTVGTDAPVLTLQVPANGTVIRAYPVGLALGTGIAWAATGVITDADTTAIGANDLSIDIDYK